jgi:hypothetical protein
MADRREYKQEARCDRDVGRDTEDPPERLTVNDEPIVWIKGGGPEKADAESSYDDQVSAKHQ